MQCCESAGRDGAVARCHRFYQTVPSEGQGGLGVSRHLSRRPRISFRDAIRRFFAKYATFRGRAGRGEYWWWVLASMIVSIILQVVITASTSLALVVMVLLPSPARSPLPSASASCRSRQAALPDHPHQMSPPSSLDASALASESPSPACLSSRSNRVLWRWEAGARSEPGCCSWSG
ncbi:DUF805 domain-containing protein [Sinomonas flava]|uniref:DUF805 domain-containing protein n=1 Tax=Sinomonas flava TaxID=496857 RepID=UPI0039A55181